MLLTCGKESADASKTFSGLRSQCTMFLKWRWRSATRICPKRNLGFSEGCHTFSYSRCYEIWVYNPMMGLFPCVYGVWHCGNSGCFWETYLWDKELSDAFWQPPFLTRQYHLQHVTMELLHDNKHTLWRLKHTLQVHHPRVVEILTNTNTNLELKELRVIIFIAHFCSVHTQRHFGSSDSLRLGLFSMPAHL